MRCIGVHLMGGHVDIDEYGEPIIGEHILILFNADHAQEIAFALPEVNDVGPWERLFDTATGLVDASEPAEPGKDVSEADAYKLAPCSMAVFRAKAPVAAEPDALL